MNLNLIKDGEDAGSKDGEMRGIKQECHPTRTCGSQNYHALSYAARSSWERERRAVSSGDDDKLALDEVPYDYGKERNGRKTRNIVENPPKHLGHPTAIRVD
uniref:Uncharacterized protein n=1 Tax=Oryza punctata TaxID=4537 RepID=A0A0E0L7L2_ORYPU